MKARPRVFCVNLKSREDRWKEFVAQPGVQILKEATRFEKFDAVVGADINIMEDERISVRAKRNITLKTRRDHEDLNTKGAVGCYLSHTAIWKEIAEGPDPYAIIFEDDIAVPADFWVRFKQLEREFAAQKADIWTFNYGWNFYYEPKGRRYPQNDPTNFHGDWLHNTTPGGTGSYLMTKEGAQKLLACAFPMDMHIDFFIAANTELGTVRVVAHKHLRLTVLSTFILSDITPYQTCTICNMQTDMKNRHELKIIAGLTAALLLTGAYAWFASRGRGRGRR